MATPQKIKSPRTTVVGYVYYQPSHGSPISIPIRYAVTGTEDEQLYVRSLQADDDWKPLDYGWVKNPGMVVLRNDRVEFKVKPTREERAEADSLILQVGMKVGDAVYPFQKVYPGGSFPLTPVDPAVLFIRCSNGRARYTISVIPG